MLFDGRFSTEKNRKGWLPAYKRIEILNKTIRMMEGQYDELPYQIANEGGKPLVDVGDDWARSAFTKWLNLGPLTNAASRRDDV